MAFKKASKSTLCVEIKPLYKVLEVITLVNILAALQITATQILKLKNNILYKPD